MSGSLCCSQPAPFSSCRLITLPSQLHNQTSCSHQDRLEVTVGREVQDVEYAQWFYQCNLKVHGFCASLVYFYFLLVVGYYSSRC